MIVGVGRSWDVVAGCVGVARERGLTNIDDGDSDEHGCVGARAATSMGTSAAMRTATARLPSRRPVAALSTAAAASAHDGHCYQHTCVGERGSEHDDDHDNEHCGFDCAWLAVFVRGMGRIAGGMAGEAGIVSSLRVVFKRGGVGVGTSSGGLGLGVTHTRAHTSARQSLACAAFAWAYIRTCSRSRLFLW